MDGGTGNDTFYYNSAENTSYTNIYSGGDGTDTLRLYLSSTSLTQTVREDVLTLMRFIDDNNDPLTNNGVTHSMTTTDLTVDGFEHLNVYVDNSLTQITPDAKDDLISGDEDTVISGNVMADNGNGYDTGWDDDLSVVAGTYSTVQGGTVVLNADGSFTYKPVADFNGADSFEYTITDSYGYTDIASALITVNPVNDIPVAQADSAVTDEDNAIVIDVLSNDSDIDNDTLFVSNVGSADHGSVVINGDNTVTYTPDADYNGTDSFDYTVSDGNGGEVTQTVTLTVNPVNDAPVAVADTFSGDEDTVISGNVLVNDSDIDLDTLTVTEETITTANGATVSILANGDFTYTPDADYNGTDSFDYTVSDGNGGEVTQTVTLTVNPVNDAPVAVADSFNGDEDTVINGNVLVNDSDVDLDTLTVTEETLTTANGATVSIVANGDFTYTPTADYNGTDSFDYTVSDGNGGEVTQTVTLTVNPVNDAPVAVADSFSGDEDTVINGNVLVNDSDVDLDTLTVTEETITTANGATVSILTNGDFTYTPVADYNGTDSFDYTVSDGNGGEVTQTVTLTVNPVNDAPVAVADTFSGDEDTVISGNVLVNDTDVDLDTLTVTEEIITTANGATVSILTNGDFTYTPVADYNGTDSFDYTVSDGNGGEVTQTVTLTVNPVNDAPVAVADSASVDEDGSIVLSVLGNDYDVDNDGLNVIAITSAAHGSAVLNGDDTVTYTPDADYNGADSFDYTVSDGNGGEVTQTVSLTVNSINDAPVAQDDSFDVQSDTSHSGNMFVDNGNGADSDVDIGDVLSTAAGTYATDHGTIVVDSDGDFTYTPDAGYTGTDSFDYTLEDSHSGSDIGTLSFSIAQHVVSGTSGDDSLSGTSGGDYYDGGLGNDVIYGGGGNDTYHFARGDGADTVIENDSVSLQDLIEFDSGVDSDQLWFEQSGDDLVISTIGTNDSVTVSDWYVDSSHQVDIIHSGDGYALSSGDVQTLVNAMASEVKPDFGTTELSPTQYDTLLDIIDGTWDQIPQS